jgi:hypothetical protein
MRVSKSNGVAACVVLAFVFGALALASAGRERRMARGFPTMSKDSGEAEIHSLRDGSGVSIEWFAEFNGLPKTTEMVWFTDWRTPDGLFEHEQLYDTFVLNEGEPSGHVFLETLSLPGPGTYYIIVGAKGVLRGIPSPTSFKRVIVQEC